MSQQNSQTKSVRSKRPQSSKPKPQKQQQIVLQNSVQNPISVLSQVEQRQQLQQRYKAQLYKTKIQQALLTNNKTNVLRVLFMQFDKNFQGRSDKEKQKKWNTLVKGFIARNLTTCKGEPFDIKHSYFNEKMISSPSEQYVQNQYLLFGCDLMSHRYLEKMFQSYAPAIKWVNSSHVKLTFMQKNQGWEAIVNNCKDVSTFMRDLQENLKVQNLMNNLNLQNQQLQDIQTEQKQKQQKSKNKYQEDYEKFQKLKKRYVILKKYVELPGYHEFGFKRRLMIRNVTKAEQLMIYNLPPNKHQIHKATDSNQIPIVSSISPASEHQQGQEVINVQSKQQPKDSSKQVVISDYKKYLKIRQDFWKDIQQNQFVKPEYERIKARQQEQRQIIKLRGRTAKPKHDRQNDKFSNHYGEHNNYKRYQNNYNQGHYYNKGGYNNQNGHQNSYQDGRGFHKGEYSRNFSRSKDKYGNQKGNQEENAYNNDKNNGQVNEVNMNEQRQRSRQYGQYPRGDSNFRKGNRGGYNNSYGRRNRYQRYDNIEHQFNTYAQQTEGIRMLHRPHEYCELAFVDKQGRPYYVNRLYQPVDNHPEYNDAQFNYLPPRQDRRDRNPQSEQNSTYEYQGNSQNIPNIEPNSYNPNEQRYPPPPRYNGTYTNNGNHNNSYNNNSYNRGPKIIQRGDHKIIINRRTDIAQSNFQKYIALRKQQQELQNKPAKDHKKRHSKKHSAHQSQLQDPNFSIIMQNNASTSKENDQNQSINLQSSSNYNQNNENTNWDQLLDQIGQDKSINHGNDDDQSNSESSGLNFLLEQYNSQQQNNGDGQIQLQKPKEGENKNFIKKQPLIKQQFISKKISNIVCQKVQKQHLREWLDSDLKQKNIEDDDTTNQRRNNVKKNSKTLSQKGSQFFNQQELQQDIQTQMPVHQMKKNKFEGQHMKKIPKKKKNGQVTRDYV